MNLLDDARRRRYCRILFDGCGSQPPSHRPMWSTSNRRSQVTVRSLFSIHFLVAVRATSRPRSQTIEPDCASASGQSADPSSTSDRHRHAATATSPVSRRCVGAALSAPIHCRTSTRNRHRRSEWAGVSWPNDDASSASGGDDIGRALARTRTARSTRSVTSRFALSFERWRGRRHASVRGANGRATPQRFIEVRRP